MIEWFTTVQLAVAVIAGLLCLVLGASGHPPNDWSILATATVAVLLVAQIFVGIAAPLVGNTPTGDLVEWWIYLVVALVLPVAAIFWALVDRSRWATVVLGVTALAVAVMVFRMNQIWFVQGVALVG